MTSIADTIALSSLKKGDHFAIDNGPTMIFEWVDYPEIGSEAVISYHTPDYPNRVRKVYLIQVNDFAFYAR
jgi:hypothetical protein